MSDAVLVAFIVTAGTVINALIGLAALRQSRQTHELVNGVSTALRTAEMGQARAEGITVGEQSQRDREGAHG